MNQLARREPTDLRRTDEAVNPFAEFRILSKHSETPVALVEQQDWAATISAGYAEERNGRRIPVVSRDNKIILHDAEGNAPFLQECLETNDYRSLTISFASNNPSEIFAQSYVNYTATRLLARGDDRSITVFDAENGRRVFLAGTPEYAAAKAKCQITRSMFFVLADWIDGEPQIIFDPRDGFVVYRLNTGSETSFKRLQAQLAQTWNRARGNVITIPFELSISNERRADGKGELRNVPIWRLVVKPPTGVHFGLRQFEAMANSALEQSRGLALPAPPSPELEGRIIEADFRHLVDEESAAMRLDQPALERMQRGSPVDAVHARRRFFAISRGSRFAADPGRGDWLTAWTDGNTDSLKEFLATSTQEEVDAALACLERCKADGDRLPRPWEGLDDVDAANQVAATEGAFVEVPAETVQVIDRITGEITEQPVTTSAPSIQDDDILSLQVDRRRALEQATTVEALKLAAHDVDRDKSLLGEVAVGILREVYKQRLAALGGKS